MEIIYIIIGILVGIALPLQTSSNSGLRFKVKSPYLAAMIAFIIGTIFLGIVTLISGQPLGVPMSLIQSQPAWIWIGGVLGLIAGTSNILLFPHLGAIQTVIMPIVGQIIFSMLVDNFGWFDLPTHPFTFLRLIGIIVLLVGILMIIYQPGAFKMKKGGQIFWQLFGVASGMSLAAQTAINGHLGKVLNAPIHASFISFFTGAIVITIGTLMGRQHPSNIKLAFNRHNHLWIWLGGVLGGLLVLGNLFLSPLIGTGTTVILVLLGNIIGSIIINRFGIWNAPKRAVDPHQYIGLIVMVIGVAAIKLF
ncbi:membrane protein [Philodulcilactobacillus myokoensis]|uniref:Membrane protein n=1 Tax=Philodulcilactobacillus myokoensis TaxID=2929573 RepID=A0A9W6AZL1_9LACO|nr:DMT family transporter [Philodulcilactobacillus myokoensis]GLB46337.1 membrane protein [Philodulcilactobacillus myokoensis]